VIRNYRYSLSLIPPVLTAAGNMAGGWLTGLNAFFSLIVLALLERLLPEDTDNRTDQNDFFPDLLLYLHVGMQMICMMTFFYALQNHVLNVFQFGLMILSTGMNSGASAIVIAHELIHRKNRWHRRAGKLLLLTAGNIYFYVNHLIIHHKWVGTHRDPATARYGESLYRFFFRTTWEQIVTSFQCETARLKNSPILIAFLRNYVTGSLLLIAVGWAALYHWIGWQAVAAWLGQALLANFLLEYTNYVEHYGLTRAEDERITEIHSWQSDKVISRFFLIDLSRHSDHHYYAAKPYHHLKSYATSPVLPWGYVSMIYYALIPPLWFKTIHPLLPAGTEKATGH
jgi:alkane 1-monooxygenase